MKYLKNFESFTYDEINNEGLFSKDKKISDLNPEQDKDSIFKTFLNKFKLGNDTLVSKLYHSIARLDNGAAKLLEILKKAAEDGFKGVVAATNMKKVDGKNVYKDLVYVPAAEKNKVNKFGAYVD